MRYIRFRNAEPESPLCYAALARWFQLSGDSRFALESLEKGRDKMQNEEHDPFYLATMISLLIEQGEFDRADECFQKLAQTAHRLRILAGEGQILQEVRGEYAEAIQAYDRALHDWPGPARLADPQSQGKLPGSAAGPGRSRPRARASQGHRELDGRKGAPAAALCAGLPDDPELLQELVDFYQKIDRPREATAWSEHIARLRSQPSSGETQPAATPLAKP